MVSARCKTLVKTELEKLDIPWASIELGEIVVTKKLSFSDTETLTAALKESGLEILLDKRNILVESIKTIIIKMIHYSDDLPAENYSTYISSLLNHNYTYLANVFSENEGITIEHYIIFHKIEKAKELLRYNELNITEISYKLHYSSVAHLSNQFKKVTGMTPSFFKNEDKLRKCLENMED